MPDPAHSDAEYILPHLNYLHEVIAFLDNPEVLIEKKVTLIPDIVWGSCDAIVVCRESKCLWVVDLKTGRGHIVSPKYNTQLGTYALAVAKDLGIDLMDGWIVTLAITQAAGEGFDGADDWVADVPWLVNDLLPRIEVAAAQYAAIHSGGVLIPSNSEPVAGSHCLWCPAKPSCPAQIKQLGEVFPIDIEPTKVVIKPAGPPAVDTLTNEQVASILDIAPQIEAYLNAVRARAMANPPKGWKIVEGRANRKVKDEEAVVSLLKEHAIDPFKETLIPLGQMEKALGKNKTLLEPFIERPRGKPSLVPEADPRPAYDPFLLADEAEL